MNDKKPLLAHRQYGKDEDSTQALIKKQEAIELEIDGYSVKVAELETESQRMLRKEHFDSDTIRERQVTQHMQHHLIDWISYLQVVDYMQCHMWKRKLFLTV